ncbi:MAG: hypothetical protein R2725_03605 [Solirubrobacterales bacterium]
MCDEPQLPGLPPAPFPDLNYILPGENSVAAWKTVEEFRAVVVQLLEKGLVDRVDEAFADLAKDFAGNDLAQNWLETRRRANEARLKEDDVPVAGVNHLMRLLVADRSGQRQLCSLLAEQANLPDGFWEADFTAFRSVRNRGNLAVFFDGPKPVRLIDTSPLVKSFKGWTEAAPPSSPTAS